MDTVVYDIASKKMLFRAPGTSRVTGKSTLVNLSEELRADSIESFEVAADDMVVNLKNQLSTFKQRIKDDPSQVEISHREGYKNGSGAIGAVGITFLFSLVLVARLRKHYKSGTRKGV